jgi:hypothetical protein
MLLKLNQQARIISINNAATDESAESSTGSGTATAGG